MKLTLVRTALLVSASAATFALSSCESMTGNPREGGLFWNERKAQDRLRDREDHLDYLKDKTRQTRSDSARTQRKIDRLR
jgi:hypothetical protein